MTHMHGLLTYDGVYCSYQVTARRQKDGVALTATVRPMLRDDELSGGREAVIPCADDLARQLATYVGIARPSTVQYDYFAGSARVRLHVPTPLSSRTLLEHLGEEFRERHRIVFPASLTSVWRA